MSILTLASGASASRGYEYYQGKKVLRAEQIGETKYQGRVLGRGGAYDVLIDTTHARSSSCTCPHAAGTRKICKHMVALYFTVFPQEAVKYWQDWEEAMREEERLQAEMDNRLEQAIRRMTKAQLQEALTDLLGECPEWLYEQFLYTYVDMEDLEDDDPDDWDDFDEPDDWEE